MKGKEWVFQFRFWPNNNSRMYVLEGVTPCIQSMQLQAGDTGTIIEFFFKEQSVNSFEPFPHTSSRFLAQLHSVVWIQKENF